MKVRAGVLVVVALALPSGCYALFGSRAEGSLEGLECTAEDDCGDGLACIDGVCVATSEDDGTCTLEGSSVVAPPGVVAGADSLDFTCSNLGADGATALLSGCVGVAEPVDPRAAFVFLDDVNRGVTLGQAAIERGGTRCTELIGAERALSYAFDTPVPVGVPLAATVVFTTGSFVVTETLFVVPPGSGPDSVADFSPYTLEEYGGIAEILGSSNVEDTFVAGLVADCALRAVTNAAVFFPDVPGAIVRFDAQQRFAGREATAADGFFLAGGFSGATTSEVVAYGLDPSCEASCGSCAAIARLPLRIPEGPMVVVPVLRP
jgi:hypothetical protein